MASKSKKGPPLGRTADLGGENTFSSILDRELIARIREWQAADSERDRTMAACRAAEERHKVATARAVETLSSINGSLDNGFCVIFDGKAWEIDRDVDGSAILFANDVIVIQD